MLMRKSVLALFILLSLGLNLSAQIRTISGQVLAGNHNPISGATILIRGSKKASVANEEGKFSIQSKLNGPITLVVSAVGFETKELPAGQDEMTIIVLKEISKDLNEVVVVGYGTARKKDLTGSVSSVNMKDQEKTPVIGTAQMLEGQAAGVQVTQNQSQPGGSVFSIRIRGTNSINSSSEPLYVVDGYAGADISTLNPSDIVSFDILKDASATAIYGSRGANGVIMITTRRGKAGAKSITFDAYTGVQQVGKKYKVMNATQYGTFMDSLQSQLNQLNSTTTALPYTSAQISSFGGGTDWQNQIFRSAPVSNFSLAFTGGNADSRHYLSFSYYDQKGIIIGSDYRRGIVRMNLDQNLSARLRTGFSSQVSYDYQNAPTVNTSGGGTTPSVLWDAVRFNPILPVKDSTGNYTYQNGPSPLASIIGNPIAYANQAQDGIYNFRSFINTYGEIDIIKGLRFKTSFGVDYRNRGEKKFVPTTLYVAAANGGSASQSTQQLYNWLNENTLTFDKVFGGIHAVNVVAGFTFQHWYDKSSSAGITNLSTNNVGADNLGVGIATTPSSNYSDNVLASYFARANYRLMDKYLFTFTMRADGSSRFGANNKWGYFPSGAFAWRVSDEKFMSHVKQISDFKLRTSYGVTGNQEIGSYLSEGQYTSNAYSMGATPSPVVGIAPSNIANPNLKWESTASFDIGMDLGFWNNRVIFTGDYYHKKTSNLLLNESIPVTAGVSSILKNAGSVQNKGYELSLSTRNIETGKFRWTTTINYSQNFNKVLNLGTNKQIYVGNLSSSVFPSAPFKSSILQVGQPIGSFYGYLFQGIWQSQADILHSGTKQAVKPGDPIYKDLNGDSILNGSDRTILGHALPKFTYGMTNNFSYGRINLMVFLQGVYGNNIFNENLYEIQNGSYAFNKVSYVLTDSWTGPGTSNTNARITSVLRRSTGITSDVIENGSYLRIKTVTLSYNLPLPKLTTVFKNAVIYFTAQNLVTITKYSGYDPEVNSFDTTNANSLSLGTDYNAYPNYRSYLAGIKLGF